MSRGALLAGSALVAFALGAALALVEPDEAPRAPGVATVRPDASARTTTPVAPPRLSLLAVSVVREEDGRPLAGALVIVRADGVDERGHTDAAGQARFFVAAGPAYRVSVPVGTDRDVARSVALGAEGVAVTLAVPTGHVLAGVVRDARGEPLAGVDVVARLGAVEGARKGTTDATGAYRLAGLPGGALPLEARALGSRELRQQATCSLPPTAEGLVETRVDFVFVAGAPCQGVVRDEHGRPVRDAVVLAETTARFDPFEARTDASGRFSFPFALPGEAASFQVEREDVRQEVAVRRRLEPGRLIELELTVVSGGELAGRVVDANGVGFASAKVVAERAGSDGAAQAAATTDLDGRFRLTSLLPGSYRCRVVCRGYPDTLGPWHEVASGRSLDVGALRLEDGVPARGRVLDDQGRPAADARVDARGDDGRERHARTDAAGEFAIEGLTPGGRLRLRATRGDVASAEQEVSITPAGAFGLTLALGPSSLLQGVVRDAAGTAVSGAWVVALAADATPVRSDADGRFGVSLGEAGPRAVLVCAPGLQPARVDAPSGGPLEVVLAPVSASIRGPGLHGRLVLDGAADRHVIVMARRGGAASLVDVEVAAADADGRFTVSLPGEGGPWELLAMDLTGGEEQVLGQRLVSAAEASAPVEWRP